MPMQLDSLIDANRALRDSVILQKALEARND